MLTGRAFKFGDNISTDQIIPGRFAHLRSNLPELAKHAMEDAAPTFDRIYSLIFNQVSGDREAAQDITQETFLAALKSVGKFRGQSKVYTWLYSIASKKVADFYRRQKREVKYQTESSHIHAVELDRIPGGDPLVSSTVESEETRRAVQETLSCLPLHYRQVLLLKYVEEMPVLEISQVMKRSPKSIEGLLTRARKELQNRLSAQNEG
ncbi:unnamed protein product [marine sediment metagenome]|uniref:RNA polymerase sigma factor n=1 Tax=marine sediment metagenome TaxID=412755 RepID=X1R1V5_9ZZZZ